MTERNFALEEAIRRAPDDTDALAVYADWLLERGHRYGELVMLQILRRREGMTKKEARALANREGLLMSNLESLFGPLGRAMDRKIVVARFVNGLPQEAVVDGSVDALRQLLSHHGSAFLRTLAVRHHSGEESSARDYCHVVRECGLPPALSSASLPFADVDAAEQGAVLGRITTLELGGSWLVPLTLASTEELTIDGAPRNLEAIALTSAPRLRRLAVKRLNFGDATCTAALLRCAVVLAGIPELSLHRHLGAGWPDAVRAVLPKAELLPF